MKTTIKTAISIDIETYKKVERLSNKLKISRSQFFSQAARYMLEKDENIDLLIRINTALRNGKQDEKIIKNGKEYTGSNIIEKW